MGSEEENLDPLASFSAFRAHCEGRLDQRLELVHKDPAH